MNTVRTKFYVEKLRKKNKYEGELVVPFQNLGTLIKFIINETRG